MLWTSQYVDALQQNVKLESVFVCPIEVGFASVYLLSTFEKVPRKLTCL